MALRMTRIRHFDIQNQIFFSGEGHNFWAAFDLAPPVCKLDPPLPVTDVETKVAPLRALTPIGARRIFSRVRRQITGRWSGDGH